MRETSFTLTPQSKEHDARVGVRAKVSFTPSPNAVEDFRSTTITNSNVSDVVSEAIFGQLVVVTDEEVIEYGSSHIALPELTEAYYEHTIDSENDVVDEAEHDVAARYSSRSSVNDTPIVPLPQRMLRQALSSLASPVPTADIESNPQLHVGNERHVLFYTSSLGIRLNRGTDGYVRILSVSQLDNDEDRVGDIFGGDVVREVNGVNLRHTPIDSSDWKMIIGLMKMSPRPLKIVVAEELFNVDSSSSTTSSACGTTLDIIHEQQSKEDNRRRSGATKAFMHFMKRPSASEMNANDDNSTKKMQPTLEELSEDHLASIDLDHSQDALEEDDRFEESMLTTTQMNNLL